MVPIVERVRSLVSTWQPVPMSPEREAAFERYGRERFSRHGTVLAVCCIAGSLLWWPIDYLIYRDLTQFIGPSQRWRMVVTAVGALYLLLTRFRLFRTHDRTLLIASGLVLTAAMAWAAGLMGGPELPHFHLLYILACGTIAMPLRFVPRVAVTCAFAVALFVGFLVPFPEYLASPFLGLGMSFSICVVALSVTFGHASYLLLRTNFFQAALLAENNTLLEERVAERTRELRELLSRLETTREEERSRIAREIHDELGQELTAQRLTLAIAEDCLDGEPDTARRKLGELRAMLEQTMSTVRNLIADLRPWVLHDLGLAEAAQWLARRTEEVAGLECKLLVEGDLASIDRERSGAVFRILQESLNNVTKHAQAKSVAIDITTANGTLMLRVQDDGIGPSELPAGRGFGLLGMRERAQSFGGDFALRGLRDGGTEVTCRLPLTPRPT